MYFSDREDNHSHIVIHLENYLQSLAARKFSKKSIQTYRIALSRFYSFLIDNGLKRLQDVSGGDLEQYRRELMDDDFADASLVVYLRAVLHLFTFLEECQAIFVNPAKGMVIPQARNKLMPVPSEKEVKSLLAAPDVSTLTGIRDRAVMEILYSAGVRLAELVGMNIFDVNIKQGHARVLGKGNRERVVPLGRKAASWMKKYLSDVRPVFAKNRPDERALWLGRMGKRFNPLIVERMLKTYSIEAGISPTITPHSLRRACTTHMLQNNAHPVEIQMLLGHGSLKSLSQYLKITIRDMKKMHNQSRPGR